MTNDQDYLRLLAIFHYVVGGVAGLCAFFPLNLLALGRSLLDGNPAAAGSALNVTLWGWMCVLLGAVGIIQVWVSGAAMMIAGWLLHQRRGYACCLVMAGLACLFRPLGTALGIVTLVVLLRPGVKERFRATRPDTNPVRPVGV
jgi:hypothetical protein